MDNPEQSGPIRYEGGDIEKYLADAKASVAAFEMLAGAGMEEGLASDLVNVGHQLAHTMAMHVPVENREVSYRALVIACGMLGGLIMDGVRNPIALINVLSVAAEHLMEVEREEKEYEG